jgi:hypothetical protein
MALQPQRERHWAQNEGVATSSLIPAVRPLSVAQVIHDLVALRLTPEFAGVCKCHRWVVFEISACRMG